jgi:hypothetical protein
MDRTERILDPIANYPSSCRDIVKILAWVSFNYPLRGSYDVSIFSIHCNPYYPVNLKRV